MKGTHEVVVTHLYSFLYRRLPVPPVWTRAQNRYRLKARRYIASVASGNGLTNCQARHLDVHIMPRRYRRKRL
jgi:hypothetical protein